MWSKKAERQGSLYFSLGRPPAVPHSPEDEPEDCLERKGKEELTLRFLIINSD